MNKLKGIGKSEHERIAEMLSAYIDGELDAAQKAGVETHLRECQDCARDLHTLRQTVSLLGQLPKVKVPRSFVIREAQVAPRRRASVRWSWAYPALQGATALAFLLFVVVFVGDMTLTHFAPAMSRAPRLAYYSAPAEEASADQWGVQETAEQVEGTVTVEKVAIAVTDTPVEMPVPPVPTGTPAPAILEETQNAGLPTEEAMMTMAEQTPAVTLTVVVEATPAPTEEAMRVMVERSPAATPPPPGEATPSPAETPVEVVSRQGLGGGVPEEARTTGGPPLASPARVTLWVIEGALLILAVALLAATLWMRRARRQL